MFFVLKTGRFPSCRLKTHNQESADCGQNIREWRWALVGLFNQNNSFQPVKTLPKFWLGYFVSGDAHDKTGELNCVDNKDWP